MIEFELKKYNNKYTVRVLKDGSIYLFNEKVSGKYKNILNTLKKFPHFYGEFSIEEVPILDFIDEVKYENKKYKINHSTV